jgi:hypothetical protein
VFAYNELLVCCLQVSRLLKVLQQSDAIGPAPSAAVDTDSDHSGEGSNTDSGRGTSEVETDNSRMSKAPPIANGNEHRDPMPPPPPCKAVALYINDSIKIESEKIVCFVYGVEKKLVPCVSARCQ